MAQPRSNLETGRPDIYYIILDAYGREDALEEFYGYDNSEFINFLRSKGFFVASQSQANYLTTELSLASSLNMSYLQPLSTASRLTRASVLKRLISDNQARSILKSHGYQFVSFSTPFSFTNITDADLFLSLNKDRARETYLEAQILPGSVASIPLWAGKISPGGATFRDEQDRIQYIFDELGRLSEIPGPKFIFAHIIAPHPPFMFDQNGPVTPDKPYVQGFQGKDERMADYVGQLSYTNRLVEKTIEAILEKSPAPPVIIIQGDHGSGAYFSLQSKEHSCLGERAAILNAYYMPGLHKIRFTRPYHP